MKDYIVIKINERVLWKVCLTLGILWVLFLFFYAIPISIYKKGKEAGADDFGRKVASNYEQFKTIEVSNKTSSTIYKREDLCYEKGDFRILDNVPDYRTQIMPYYFTMGNGTPFYRGAN